MEKENVNNETVVEETVEEIVIEDKKKISKSKVIKVAGGIGLAVGALVLVNALTKKPEIVAEVIDVVSDEVGE